MVLVWLYFTPKVVFGCANRGYMARAVVFAAASAAVHSTWKGISGRRKGSGEAVLAWWVARTGPATVCRTIVHNVSGIDDHRIFPVRRLEASPTPFRFRERANPQRIRFRVTAGRPAGAPLDELLEAIETTAFLVVQGDAIVYEGYFRGYDRAGFRENRAPVLEEGGVGGPPRRARNLDRRFRGG